MSEPQSSRTYCHGDEVRMRMQFTHDGHISAVEVQYVSHDDPTSSLTLTGNPEPMEDSRVAGKGKLSVVELTGVVDEALPIGTYSVQRVTVYSLVGGTEVGLVGTTEWPMLTIDHGWPNVRGVSVELEPE